MNHKKHFLLFALFLFAFQGFAQIESTDIDVNYTGIKHLIVRGDFCDVNIEGVSGNQAIVKGNASGRNVNFIRIEHSFAQGILEIWVEYREFDLDRATRNQPKGIINISIPTDCGVVAVNTTGNLKAKNLSGKSMSLKARSGDVEAENFIGNLQISSDHGDISVDGLKGELSGRTKTGKQKFHNTVGAIYSISRNGDVEINNSVGNVNVITTSGEVSLSNTKGMATLNTDSGDIDGRQVLLTQNSNIKSETGDVDIDLKNELSEVAFSLKTRKGKLSVGEKQAKKELILPTDAIMIEGVSDSGNQKYR